MRTISPHKTKLKLWRRKQRIIGEKQLTMHTFCYFFSIYKNNYLVLKKKKKKKKKTSNSNIKNSNKLREYNHGLIRTPMLPPLNQALQILSYLSSSSTRVMLLPWLTL